MAVDWWAFGVFLYEMMAGFSPFYDEDVTNTYKKILSGRFGFPAHFSVNARDLIRKFLQVPYSSLQPVVPLKHASIHDNSSKFLPLRLQARWIIEELLSVRHQIHGICPCHCRLICPRGMGAWLEERMISRATPGSREWTGTGWPGERIHRP